MDQKNKIAENMKLLRNEKGLTQKQLAEATGISYKSIINYENAYREPNNDALKKIEEYFNVSGAFLRGETPLRNFGYIWNDTEVLDAVSDDLWTLVREIYSNSQGCTSKNKKLTFDILVELNHILKVSNENQKEATLDALQTNVSALSKFIDICRYSSSNENFEIGRMHKIKEQTTNSISDTLDNLITKLKSIDE